MTSDSDQKCLTCGFYNGQHARDCRLMVRPPCGGWSEAPTASPMGAVMFDPPHDAIREIMELGNMGHGSAADWLRRHREKFWPTVSPPDPKDQADSVAALRDEWDGPAVSPTPPSGASADGWIACSERMPEDCERVLIYLDYLVCGKPAQRTMTGYFERGEIWDDDENDTGWTDDAATHWRLLPPPPGAIAVHGHPEPRREAGDVTCD